MGTAMFKNCLGGRAGGAESELKLKINCYLGPLLLWGREVGHELSEF